MRVNPAQINAYTRKIDRPLTRTSVEQWPGSRPHGSDGGGGLMGALGRGGEGAIQGVLTPEESRFIAALFPRQERAGANVGQVYTHAGRPMPGSIPGLRLDLKG